MKIYYLICHLISKLPRPFLLMVMYILKEHHVGAIMKYRSEHFCKRFIDNPDKELEILKKKNKFMMFSDNGLYDAFFTGAYYCHCLNIILYALSLGFIPVFSDDDKSKTRLWIKLFNNPSIVLGKNNYMTINRKSRNVETGCGINILIANDKHSNRFLCARILAKKFTIPTSYLTSIIGKDELDYSLMLGTIIRGTDYKILSPIGHPKQPTIEELGLIIENEIKNNDYKSLFVATEDSTCYKLLKEMFNERLHVLTHTDFFISDVYTRNHLFINEVVVDNDSHEKQYLKNLYGLLRCNKVVGAMSGGALFVYLNIDVLDKFVLLDYGYY